MKMFASGFLFKSLHLALIREARGPQLFFWARCFIGTALICCEWHSLGGIPLLFKRYYSSTFGLLMTSGRPRRESRAAHLHLGAGGRITPRFPCSRLAIVSRWQGLSCDSASPDTEEALGTI